MAEKKPQKKGDGPKASKGGAKAAAPKAEVKAASTPAPAPAKVEAPAPAPAKVEASPAALLADTAPAKHRAFRRKLVGRVVSNKMAKTVTVEVSRAALDPVYKKYVRSRMKYKAHDETNQYKVGDRVEIQEHRPISREKRWIVTKLISRPVEE